MKFTKLQKGKYKFEGIDNWNGEWIEGEIHHQPYDVKLSQQWQVIFINDYHTHTAFFGSTLKRCKDWLTAPLQ
tara:strand:+ start:1458 stop:1676 length:219 start_codon:yes stop_codon:yes gene_type:complete